MKTIVPKIYKPRVRWGVMEGRVANYKKGKYLENIAEHHAKMGA